MGVDEAGFGRRRRPDRASYLPLDLRARDGKVNHVEHVKEAALAAPRLTRRLPAG